MPTIDNNIDIKLRFNNPYASGYINAYSETGETELLRERLTLKPQEGDNKCTVQEGDMIDEIAERYYADFIDDACKLWFVIADVNDVFDPLDLSEWEGKVLFIPQWIRVKFALKIQ